MLKMIAHDTGDVVDDGKEDSKLENWKKVKTILASVEKEEQQGIVRLGHPAGSIFVFERSAPEEANGRICIRKFAGDNELFSHNLHLRGSTMNDHMPWSYNSLFEGCSVFDEMSSKEFDKILLC